MAERDGAAVGFVSIDANGHVDLAYVLPSAARQGVGSALLRAAEAWAAQRGVGELSTEASLAARGFFEAHGWQVVEAQAVERRGITLRRFAMRKRLV